MVLKWREKSLIKRDERKVEKERNTHIHSPTRKHTYTYTHIQISKVNMLVVGHLVKFSWLLKIWPCLAIGFTPPLSSIIVSKFILSHANQITWFRRTILEIHLYSTPYGKREYLFNIIELDRREESFCMEICGLYREKGLEWRSKSVIMSGCLVTSNALHVIIEWKQITVQALRSTLWYSFSSSSNNKIK